MKLNGFSVRIPEGYETRDGYVQMAHGTQYRLMLGNANGVRCDALVKIDGRGRWTSMTDERTTFLSIAGDSCASCRPIALRTKPGYGL